METFRNQLKSFVQTLLAAIAGILRERESECVEVSVYNHVVVTFWWLAMEMGPERVRTRSNRCRTDTDRALVLCTNSWRTTRIKNIIKKVGDDDDDLRTIADGRFWGLEVTLGSLSSQLV